MICRHQRYPWKRCAKSHRNMARISLSYKTQDKTVSFMEIHQGTTIELLCVVQCRLICSKEVLYSTVPGFLEQKAVWRKAGRHDLPPPAPDPTPTQRKHIKIQTKSEETDAKRTSHDFHHPSIHVVFIWLVRYND